MTPKWHSMGDDLLFIYLTIRTLKVLWLTIFAYYFKKNPKIQLNDTERFQTVTIGTYISLSDRYLIYSEWTVLRP